MTGVKRIEEGQELRRHEPSHQPENVFARIDGLITLSSGSIPIVQPCARTLRDRFTLLDRALAHLHRRSDAIEDRGAGTVQSLLQTLLVSYDADGDDTAGSAERRFTFVGTGDAPLGRSSATSLALVIHELATNAVRHGALSGEEGFVTVACRRDGDDLRFTWSELGGPPIEGPPGHTKFGSALMERSVTGQLGGTITRIWNPKGLIVHITLSRCRLAR